MLANLPEERFVGRDIYIDREGKWHDRGRPTTPSRALRQIDVALVGLHGEYGEGGEIQRLLGCFGIPYAGTTSFGSYFAMHKLLSKTRAQEIGLLVPKFRYVERKTDCEAVVREVIRTFSQPVVVKPVGWGSSIGVSIVGGYAPIFAAIEQLMATGAAGVLVEEYVRGREATVGIIEKFRGETLYALPTVEILSPYGDFLSYEMKYSGMTRERCPGNFSRTVTEELQSAAKAIHRTLGLRHYSRSDFILTPRGAYYLETNALPALANESLLPKSLAAVGISFPDFLSHLVDLALRR